MVGTRSVPKGRFVLVAYLSQYDGKQLLSAQGKGATHGSVFFSDIKRQLQTCTTGRPAPWLPIDQLLGKTAVQHMWRRTLVDVPLIVATNKAFRQTSSIESICIKCQYEI